MPASSLIKFNLKSVLI